MDTTTHERLYCARYARSVAGGVLIATAISMVMASVTLKLGPVVLAAGWMVSAAAVLSRRLWVPKTPDPVAASKRLLDQSIQLPMIGLTLVSPMTIHGLLALVWSHGSIGLVEISSFSRWIGLSALVVGQAHLILAWLVKRAAKQMTDSTAPMSWKPLAWDALWKTTLAACIPGLLMFAVPPLLTFATGALFIPLVYWGALRLTEVERTQQEWFVLADRVGLCPQSPVSENGLPFLSGTIDGIPVTLSGSIQMRKSIRFEMTLQLSAPDLAHLQIAVDPTTPGQLRIGEPVADAVLQITALTPGDSASLAQRMRDPSCYAVMMEVIHGHGAIIRHGQLTLGITATTLAPLWDALPYLIELARILSSPVASRTLKLAQPVRLASPAG